MKKVIKLTSGILACTLVLSNFNSLDITKANEAPSITVSSENSNISSQIQTIGDKSYLVVTAIEDVTNIGVRVNVSNNQTFVFKHSELKKGEVVNFELDIADEKQEVGSKKILPKTGIVREKLEIKGVVKGFNVSAVISYDVEKIEIAEKKEDIEISIKPTDVEKKSTEIKLDDKERKSTEIKLIEKEIKVESTVKDNKPTYEEIIEPDAAKLAKEVEDAQSDAWEKEVSDKKENKSTSSNVESSTTTTSFRAVSNVEEKPAKKLENIHADAWERAATISNGTNPNLTNSETESAILVKELNKHRAAHGKKPLAEDNSLSAGTLVRANEFAVLAVKGKTGDDLHLRLDNSKFFTAFPKEIRGKLGENVSYGTRLESLMKFWTNSPAHNRNMLSDEYTKVSIKVVRQNGMYYGVQIFSK